jgi:hypothetical protein
MDSHFIPSTSVSQHRSLLRSAIFSLLIVLCIGFAAVGAASAQTSPRGGLIIGPQVRPIVRPVGPTLLFPPACQRPTPVYIRNLLYNDYSSSTRLSFTSVATGGFFQITSNCLPLNGQVVVTLQDVNRGPGFGVTAFRLTNVRVSGNTLTAQAPALPLFRNRTYHVAVFVYGQQPWNTANPGQITIR